MHLIPRYKGLFLAVGGGGILLVVLGFPALAFPTTTIPLLIPVRGVLEAPGLLGLPVSALPAPDAELDIPPWPLPEAAASASFRAFLYVPGDS